FRSRKTGKDATQNDEVIKVKDVFSHQVGGTDGILIQKLGARRLVHDAQDASAILRQKGDAQDAVIQDHSVKGCADGRSRWTGWTVPDVARICLNRIVLKGVGRVRERHRVAHAQRSTRATAVPAAHCTTTRAGTSRAYTHAATGGAARCRTATRVPAPRPIRASSHPRRLPTAASGE